MEVTVRGIPVHYEAFGSGRTILMLHGSPVDHRSAMTAMEPIFETRSGWRRLYIDMPGHGRTPGDESITSLDGFLDVITDFVVEVAPGERISVVGISFGGLMARGLVHTRAAGLDGVCLVIPAVTMDDEKAILPPRTIIRPDPGLRAALDPDRQWIADMLVVQDDPEIVKHLNVVRVPRLRADSAFLDRVKPSFSFNVDDLSSPFPAPTLIVTGRQDSNVGYEQQFGLLPNFPRGTFVVLDRAGHLVVPEQKILFHALVNEWLDRVEEYAATS